MKVQPQNSEPTNYKLLLTNDLLHFLHDNKDDKDVKKFFKDLRALSRPPKEPKEPKPKRVLTPERLQKMKEGRERQRARKIFNESQ